MAYLLTALIAWLTYQPATEFMLSSELGHYLQSLQALSPQVAGIAGAQVLWPLLFLCACHGAARVACMNLTSSVDVVSTRAVSSASFGSAKAWTAAGHDGAVTRDLPGRATTPETPKR